jgi:hypothetical protein
MEGERVEVSTTLVQQIASRRCKTRAVSRIERCTCADEHKSADERNIAMFRGPHIHAVG